MSKLNRLQKIGIGFVVVVFLVIIGLWNFQRTIFGSTFPASGCFVSGKQATSSYSWLTPGTGTTTLTCSTATVDSISLDVISLASTTQTDIRYRIERSINNVDWFADIYPLQEFATTTTFASNYSEFRLPQTATSTGGTSQLVNLNGGASATTTASFSHINISNLGSDYTRFVFYISPSSPTNGAVWLRGNIKEVRAR